MRRRVENWTIEKLHKNRSQISFPEYQRQPNLWPSDKKELLVDSILQNIDIPKLYFNKTPQGEYEVVDGQQRLWAIWDFVDGVYAYGDSEAQRTFSQLSPKEQGTIRNYALQVTILEDASDEYLRQLFLRLQLGLLLVTGEKLHAATGAMKDFVFDTLAIHPFIQAVRIPRRRFARETLCAQIAINSFTRVRLHSFARTRYEDLVYFFKEYEDPKGADERLFAKQTRIIQETLDELWNCFADNADAMTSRSYILSAYLLFEDLLAASNSAKKRAASFLLKLWERLKGEMNAGFDRQNRELYVFETMLSSAPGERYQIERRHEKLTEYFEHFLETGEIKGDDEGVARRRN